PAPQRLSYPNDRVEDVRCSRSLFSDGFFARIRQRDSCSGSGHFLPTGCNWPSGQTLLRSSEPVQRRDKPPFFTLALVLRPACSVADADFPNWNFGGAHLADRWGCRLYGPILSGSSDAGVA